VLIERANESAHPSSIDWSFQITHGTPRDQDTRGERERVAQRVFVDESLYSDGRRAVRNVRIAE
jgi:hypothetical protein